MTNKGFVYLIGAGPGDPELITAKAQNAMENADCIIYDYLANQILIEKYDCEKIYVGKKGSDHTLTQEKIGGLIIEKALEGKIVARLKGGDPFIFGRGGEEAEELVDAGIPFSIIPGISSFYSAPAYAGIPLTHRDYANSIEVITGHRKADTKDGVNFPEYNPDKTYTFLMGMKNLSYIAESLINHKNFPEDTPVALISWGTRPNQRVATGLLKNIASIAKEEGITPPTIIVVGKVVALRSKLRWFDNQPLFGKKIVVTRTRSQASKLLKKLTGLGADVIELPTIAIEPIIDSGKLNNAINKINEFSWIIFTSQNAVNLFFSHIYSNRKDVRILGNIKVAVIGPATGDELLKYGIKPDLVPKEYVAESLIAELKKQDIKNRKIIIPCAKGARDTLENSLKDSGAEVERINIYKSVKPDNISDDVIEQLEHADIVTFTSSSTARNFFSLFPSVTAKIASIGPKTTETIIEFGTKPEIIAKEYTIEGLINAIVEYNW